MNTLFVNLFAEPGAGKSTTAAGVFSLLKLHDVNCELVTESAKECVWQKNNGPLNHNYYLTSLQRYRATILDAQVDVVITDSPFLMGGIYVPQEFETMYYHEELAEAHHLYNNFDILLRRVKPYNPIGREQSEGEAQEKRGKLEAYLKRQGVYTAPLPGNHMAVNTIASWVLRELGIVPKLRITEVDLCS